MTVGLPLLKPKPDSARIRPQSESSDFSSYRFDGLRRVALQFGCTHVEAQLLPDNELNSLISRVAAAAQVAWLE